MTHATNSIQSSVSPVEKHDPELVKQTQKWVAQTFFGTLLKQMHNSPFRSKLFEGGRGGQAFGSMYDQQMAEHMARGAGQKLVNSIVRRIEAKRAYDKSSRKPQANQTHILRPATQRSGHVQSALRA